MINSRRIWWIAALLTLFLPGLGQVYNGQLKRGLVFFGIDCLTVVIFWAMMGLPVSPFNLVIPTLIILSFTIYILRDAIVIARRIGEPYALKAYNRWYIYLSAILILGLVHSEITASKLIDAYRIPAESMAPTLLKGDYILADKFTHRFKNSGQGDIIIFKFPGNLKQKYIKRLIATEGQVVEVKKGRVYVDGKLIAEPPGLVRSNRLITILDNPKRDNFGPYLVPKGHLFVMGDNQYESYDSRFWGPLDRKLVIGQAKAIHWSWDSDAHRVRWKRIGRVVK